MIPYIVGNFQGRKFRKFCRFVQCHESFLRKFLGHGTYIRGVAHNMQQASFLA